MSSCVVGAKPVQLVPGVYTGTCISHEVAPSFRGSIKLKMAFRIEMDNETTTVIEAYYNVKKSTSNNAFEIGYHSDLYRNTVRLYKDPKAVEHFSCDDFIDFYLNKTFKVEVEYVVKNSNHRPLTKDTYYSRVAFIQSLKDTEES